MNLRDISELKRRLNPEHRNATVIRGCYVGGDGHVISTFVEELYHMPEGELEKYMAIFKKTLSGTMGQNLLPVAFSSEQTMHGEEHRLLMTLRDSALRDDEAVNALYQKIIGCIQASQANAMQSVAEAHAAGNYLILLMHDGYDVPYKDGNGDNDRERSSEVFNYVICSVCTVKQTKPALSYFAAESEFHSKESDWVVAAPEMGFLFPAFEERSADIHSALYYSRSSADLHDDFIEAVFASEPFMPADEQKETFQGILTQSLGEECSLDVVQAVHETVCTMIEERKADKHADPLTLTRQDVKAVLETCGVSEQKAEAFEEQFTETFGAYAEIPAVNVVTPKQFKVQTPSVNITVDPEYAHLIETRVIDGRSYILVLADGDVAVNGVNVKITE